MDAEELVNTFCAEMAVLAEEIRTTPLSTDIGPGVTSLMQPGPAVLKELRHRPTVSNNPPSPSKPKLKRPHTDDENELGQDTGDDHDDADVGLFRHRDDENNQINEADMLEWLDTLHHKHIVPRHQIIPTELDSTQSEVLNDIHPYTHQLKATETILYSLTTEFGGLILADPPGMGKTLSMLFAIVRATHHRRGPSVIVVPSSCTRQWKHEAERYFKPGVLSVLILNDRSTSPLELFKYKIILCSYSYLAAELAAKEKFLSAIKAYRTQESDVVPERPYLCLLSDIWKLNGIKRLGPFLCLDEAHAIKNPKSLAYRAVRAIRPRFASCIMMTGTPLDNMWYDAGALFLMLAGHEFTNKSRLRQMFTSPTELGESNTTSPLAPKGKWRQRFCQWLDAITLRRPTTFLEDSLPPRTIEQVHFELTASDKRRSDAALAAYLPVLHMSKREPDARNKGKHWSSMVKALQYASHPRLVEILHYERLHRRQSELQNDGTADKILLDDKAMEEISKWRQDLEEGDNAYSTRVDVIISIIEEVREASPDDAVIVMDESIFFLDIVEIALRKMTRKVEYWRCNGAMIPAMRSLALDSFNSAQGTRVLLATRGTCGDGLNLQAANVLIRCMPWWKVSWEEQANGRVYRPGQTKPVKIFELISNADVERHRVKRRQEKDEVNRRIMEDVTRGDDEEVMQRHIL